MSCKTERDSTYGCCFRGGSKAETRCVLELLGLRVLGLGRTFFRNDPLKP